MQVDLSAETNTIEPYKPGYSRQPRDVRDLPKPEAVFHLRRIGWEEFFLFISGPAFIALALSLGSSIWVLAPLTVRSAGLIGLGWILLIAIVLQVLYNVELGRYTLATGESPLVGFSRFPLGKILWVPLALLLLAAALLWGSGAFAAAEILFTLVNQRAPQAAEIYLLRWLTVVLLASAALLLSYGRRLSRTLEITSWVVVTTILISLLMVTFVLVPGDFSQTTLASLLAFSRPPVLSDPGQLGALLGLAALASGLNFMLISHYRDKGYGMGSLMGAFSGLIAGHKQSLSANHFTFAADETSAARWKQWFRFLLLDQSVFYLPGLLAGILIPLVLFRYVFTLAGNVSYYDRNIFISVAQHLLTQYGPLLFIWILLIGFSILFLGQVLVLETLTRSFAEGVYFSSEKVRQATHSEVRRLYYPFLLLLIFLISVTVFVFEPGEQALVAGNLANLAAAIFPMILLFLNLRLPKTARSNWFSALVLLANALFFGLLFINLLSTWLIGQSVFAF